MSNIIRTKQLVSSQILYYLEGGTHKYTLASSLCEAIKDQELRKVIEDYVPSLSIEHLEQIEVGEELSEKNMDGIVVGLVAVYNLPPFPLLTEVQRQRLAKMIPLFEEAKRIAAQKVRDYEVEEERLIREALLSAIKPRGSANFGDLSDLLGKLFR